jgi:photosystem II stability/assembly factor-like uncharacterized protein
MVRPPIVPRSPRRASRRLVAGAVAAALATCLVHEPAFAQRRRRSVAPPIPTAPTTYDSSLFLGLQYRMIGPARGGRVTAVTGVAQEPHTFYFGSTGGGVWKTTDAGDTWANVSDGYFAVGSIGALDVADSDPKTIYVGTGSEGLRSNVSIGRGIYKSSDGAKSWRLVGLRDAGQIGAVVIHPSDPSVVYVAAVGNPFAPNPERGVYRTRDGGKTWQKVLYVSDSTGAVDLELKPGNPSVVYASMWRAERKPWTIISGARGCAETGKCEGGVYKSTDGGDTWKKLGGGLPTGLVGKSDLAVSPAVPDRVYALVEAKPGGGLYRSDDAGQSWTQVSNLPGLITRPFYYTNVDADPTNADVVYVGTEGFYKSTDGGRTFKTTRTPHGDNHDMWINPEDSNIFIQSNDGGANVTLNGGRTWSTQYNQPTAELYQVYVDNQYPYRVYGAQQDNSTVIVTSLPTATASPDDPIQEWRAGPGCETGPIMPHPTNPDTVYGSCKGQYSRMSLRTGQERQYWVGGQSLYGMPGRELIYRFQRVSPMEVSPHDPRSVYYGSQYVHRTRDEGVTWERISPDLTANDPKYQGVISGEPITIDVTGEEMYSTLYAIRESPVAKGVIWTGSNDGPVYVTRNNGKTWTNVSPKDLPPGGRVQTVEPSPHRAGSAYVAVLRYLLGDFQPYIYRTDDYGRTWTRLTDGKNGIPPDEPTRVVREDPDRAGLLYAGTEFGMFVSFDNGLAWRPLQLNLPRTPVTDIKVHRRDLVVATQGRSFWILDNLTPLHQLGDQVASARAHLFRPRETVRYRYSEGFGGVESGRPVTADIPQFPPAGAMIDYYLASAPTSPLTLEILDARGGVVRRFLSEGPGEGVKEPEEPGMRRPAMDAVGTPKLPARAGLNRFTWDMTYPGPWSSDSARNGRNGPMAAPGTYTVRLTRGDWTASQPLVLRADPRVVRDGLAPADFSRQVAHNLLVRDLVSDVNFAVQQLRAARKRLDADSSQAAAGQAADARRKLEELERQLVTPPVRYSKPQLQSQVTYLYGMALGADQKVGRDAVERYRQLRRRADSQLAAVRQLLGAEQRSVGAR